MTLEHAKIKHSEQQLRDSILSGSSIFGRLIAVSSLRRQDSVYYHELSWRHGVAAVDAILRRLHREIFETWLSLSLRQQAGDLSMFLGNLDDDQRPSAAALLAARAALMPQDHIQPERDLFLGDLEIVIPVIYAGNVQSALSSRSGDSMFREHPPLTAQLRTA